jgi:hypothetical protein
MKIVKQLKKVRELLSDPKRFTKRAAARDAEGSVCSASSRKAERFCAYGACLKIGRRECGLLVNALDSAVYDLFSAPPPTVNDAKNGRRNILKAIDHAIAKLEGSANG